MNPRTRQNLITAMNCDALDAAKYSRFAARARMDENWHLARVFQDSADIDRADHFPSEAEVAGLISTSPDNLRSAVDTERAEAAMLRNFAEQATADGDLEAASVFRKVSRDKAERLARFEAVLEELGVHGDLRTLT
jgi:rubrerythrin